MFCIPKFFLTQRPLIRPHKGNFFPKTIKSHGLLLGTQEYTIHRLILNSILIEKYFKSCFLWIILWKTKSFSWTKSKFNFYFFVYLFGNLATIIHLSYFSESFTLCMVSWWPNGFSWICWSICVYLGFKYTKNHVQTSWTFGFCQWCRFS